MNYSGKNKPNSNPIYPELVEGTNPILSALGGIERNLAKLEKLDKL